MKKADLEGSIVDLTSFIRMQQKIVDTEAAGAKVLFTTGDGYDANDRSNTGRTKRGKSRKK